MILELKEVQKNFISNNREKIEVLHNINFSVNEGEFITIFGPNGCGKTTLMNVIAEIEKPSEGEIKFHKKNKKTISYLFQDYRPSLLPWKNVWQNIGIPLIWRGWDNQRVHNNVNEMIENFNILIDLNRYPFMLSGGQAQLICILRSLITKPDILLLDEPLSALDYLNHINLMLKLQEIWDTLKTTTLLISHDIEEAIFLGDKMLILSRRPAKIVELIEINLPRPRSAEIFTDKEFVRIKEKILKLITKM